MKRILLLLPLALTLCAAEFPLLRQDFKASAEGWRCPPEWPGRLVHQAEGMHLSSTVKGKEHCGQCMLTLNDHRDLSGCRYRLSLTAAGHGELRVGTNVRSENTGKWSIVWHGSVRLQPSPVRIVKEIDFSRRRVERMELILRTVGDAEATFDDIELVQLVEDDLKLDMPRCAALRQSDFRGVPVVTNAPGRTLTAFAGKEVFDLTADAEGKALIPAARIPLGPDGSAVVAVAAGGQSCTTKIAVVPTEEHDRTLALARRVAAAKRPLRIVWFGDSELDFDRGCNAAAKVDDYLDRAVPGCAVSRNYAEAGDTTRRLRDRLNGKLPMRDRETMGKEPADFIFIMLGLNDTVAYATDGFRTPAIRPAESRACSRWIFARLKTLYPGAKLVVIAPPALDFDFLKAKAEGQIAAGRKRVYRFGTPELVEAFCREWQEAAREAGAAYVDIYHEMQKLSDLRRLYKPGDEVHFNARGNGWLAERILRFLAETAAAPASPAPAVSASACIPFHLAELNRGGMAQGGASLRFAGSPVVNSEGALVLDGRSAGLSVDGLGGVTPAGGFTLELVCKGRNDKARDAFFFCPGSFCLARQDRSLCLYLQRDGKLEKLHQTRPIFPKADRFIHLAVACHSQASTDQGEYWTDFQVWMDGKKVEDQRFRDVLLPPGGPQWFVGAADAAFGNGWRLKGELLGGGIYPRVLSEKEVRRHVLEYAPKITPAFKRAAELTDKRRELLRKAGLTEPEYAACVNLAKMNFPQWEQVVAAPRQNLQTLGDGQYRLVLLTMPGKARVLSFYDTAARRDLLNWDNDFFQLVFRKRGGRPATIPMAALESRLEAPPQTRDGVTEFTIRHLRREAPACEGVSRWRFNGSRLEFTLDFASKSPETVLVEVGSLCLSLAALTQGTDYLVVPQAGGLLYEEAARRSITYATPYPRMLASMQCGAVYDKAGGVYFSPADARARVMDFRYECDTEGTCVRIGCPVAYDADYHPNRFAPGNYAVIEPFRGDWYDVGLMYRQELARIGAVWWRTKPPKTDTPEWYRRNTLNMGGNESQARLGDFLRLRRYFELPFVVQHYEWGEGKNNADLFHPLARPSLEFLECVRLLREHDIQSTIYSNGRLWATIDHRGISYFYPQQGERGVVRDAAGKPLLEPYSGVPCGVLCPASDVYQTYIPEMVLRNAAKGLSGLFVDQMGASRAVLCQSPDHGHLLNDPESWNINGQRKAILRVRQYWRSHGVEAIIETEDNAEHCVGFCDGLHPWRWLYDNQIPLFVLVYSGRMQLTSRDQSPHGEEASFYPKAAVQFVQGEQFGTYKTEMLTTAGRSDLRRYLKRLMHLRFAVCDFFNEGIMERPPKLEGGLQKIYTRWGRHGTKDVGTLPVVAGQWRLGENQLILLVNVTGSVRRGRLAAEPPRRLCIRNSSGRRTPESADFELEPYGCEFRLYGPALPQEWQSRIDSASRTIVKCATERDPFGILALLPSDPCHFKAAERQQAIRSPLVSGARVNEAQQRLDYVSMAVIFSGTGDFGTGGEGEFEVELSAPSYSNGGTISFHLDDPEGQPAATLTLDRAKVLTRDWQDFRNFRCKAAAPIVGKHRVFIRIKGNSACNLRSWRWIPGGGK